MREKYLGSIATFFDGLDPGSRLRIQVFAFKLLIIVPVSVALATQRGFPLLGTLSFFCFGIASLLERRRGSAIKGMALPC